MKAKDITTQDVNQSRFRGRNVYGIFKGFCDLVGSCEECDRKVRFWCKVKCKIESVQTKRIVKLCNQNEAKRKDSVEEAQT